MFSCKRFCYRTRAVYKSEHELSVKYILIGTTIEIRASNHSGLYLLYYRLLMRQLLRNNAKEIN
jgi:hypothetical protein